nr:hypothetical protein CFP56_23810 [Quercus suber]
MCDEAEHVSDARDQVPRVDRFKDGLVDRESRIARLCIRAIFRRAVGIPEAQAQNGHLGAGDRVLQSVKDVIVAQRFAGRDDILVEQDAEDERLEEAKTDDDLEGYKLPDTTTDFHAILHVPI